LRAGVLRSIELREVEIKEKTDKGNNERNGRDVFAMCAMEEQATTLTQRARWFRRGRGGEWATAATTNACFGKLRRRNVCAMAAKEEWRFAMGVVCGYTSVEFKQLSQENLT
jgi:hypothetical protein